MSEGAGMDMAWSAGRDMNALTGGVAEGGEASNKLGDWSGSEINMGGGSDNTPLYIILGGFFVLVFTGFVIWASSRK